MYPVYKTGITLNELPDFISFYIQFHSCSIRCEECHSKYLWGSYKKSMCIDEILLEANKGKSNGADSIILFGDINNNISIADFSLLCKELSNILPICVYSGSDTVEGSLGDVSTLKYISFIKLGRYIKELGGLSNVNTNQHLYRVNNAELGEDITNKFWR